MTPDLTQEHPAQAAPTQHAFVLFFRSGLPHHEVERLLAPLPSLTYHPVDSHPAVAVRRSSPSLAEAALEVEAELLSALSGEAWVLLCDECAHPLSVSPAGYSCTEHGVTVAFSPLPQRSSIPLPRQPRRTRHGARSRSASKRAAIQNQSSRSWALYLQEALAASRTEMPERFVADLRSAEDLLK